MESSQLQLPWRDEISDVTFTVLKSTRERTWLHNGAKTSERKQNFIHCSIKYEKSNIYRRKPPRCVATVSFLFSQMSFSRFFFFPFPQGVQENPFLIWHCIKFPQFLWKKKNNKKSFAKPSLCSNNKPGERRVFLEFEVGCTWFRGSFHGVWQSVAAPDLCRSNTRVSRASISLSAGWDTRMRLGPGKHSHSIFLKLHMH